MSEITVVGGGIAGLVAAICAAEAGARVVLHEAAGRLGGRGSTDSGTYKTNVGPHALYRHGDFEAWLLERDLLPPVVYPSLTGLRLRLDGRLRRLPLVLLKVLRSHKAEAPKDVDYRTWATERMGARAAEAAIGLASLPTFHPDPGMLSAAFIQERIHRSSVSRPVYYIQGGWGKLVEALERKAVELGVRIELRSKLSTLPGGPTVVATPLPIAARLLDDPSIDWPSPRSALLDVAIRNRRRDPTAVLDLTERVYATRLSATDPSLAPAGESLIQATAGIREGESTEAAHERIRTAMDSAWPNWRERVTWRRTGLLEGGVGPADPPGTDWRDRPAITQAPNRWLAGDRVAAPGILTEVSFESARTAARAATKAESKKALHAA